MLKIFIDTNVLLHARELNIVLKDALSNIIDGPFGIFLHPLVQDELIEAAALKNKLGRQAKFALQLTNQLIMYEDEKEYFGTDIGILTSAERERGVVLTFDKILRDRCIKKSVPVISNFKKGRLKLFGYID